MVSIESEPDKKISNEFIKFNDKEFALKMINEARRLMEEPYCDAHLANYVLRDLKIVKDAGLDDLAWAMHRECPHKNDVNFLIEQLIKYMESH